VGCLTSGAALPVAAQGTEVELTGRIVDVDEEPVVGYRVVYREVTTFEVYLGGPTDANGRFGVKVPQGGRYAAVALISPRGSRIELREQPPVEGVAGRSQEIQVMVALAAQRGPEVQRFPGGDRLFLAFVEDAAVVGRLRLEGQLDVMDFEFSDVVVARGIVAYQFTALEDVEFGASFGFGDRDADGSSAGGSGATDLDLWAKLRVRPASGRLPDLAFGAVVTLPTGDDDAGLGFDALASKLFVAARHSFNWFPSGVFSGHIGIQANDNGQVAGIPLNGKTAGAAGIAMIWPATQSLALIVEADYEGRRFEGGDADSRLLAGVNWRPLPVGNFRLAVSTGLADGAPDTQFLIGYTLER
jgi:hypothetical protein